MHPFNPEELRRIDALGALVRSVPKKAKKAELEQVMAQITADDGQLLADWMCYRISGERLKDLKKPEKLKKAETGITKPTGFVWRKGQKPEGRG